MCFNRVEQLVVSVYAVATILVVTACSPSEDRATADGPKVYSFSADKSVLLLGQCTRLVAVFGEGTGQIDNAVGEVASDQPVSVCPAETITYTLVVIGASGRTITASTTVDVIEVPAPNGRISAGRGHTCALTTGQGIRCWGTNSDGQLGDGSQGFRSVPTDVVGLESGVAAVSAGLNHSCALTSDGGVKCWGRNDLGQLGDGSGESSPIPVNVLGLEGDVVAISTGGHHSCALTRSGGIKCWGWNLRGQIGDGSTENRLVPADVLDLGTDAIAVSAGGGHTCALTIGRGVRCWGNNWVGQLGDGSGKDRLAPVDVVGLGGDVTALATGDSFSCALTTGGGVACWGYVRNGQLGNDDTERSLSPVGVRELDSGVTAISAGVRHACALTKEGGAKCWGINSCGQLGDGTTEDSPTPVDVRVPGVQLIAIALGDEHTCALTESGGAKCWGTNLEGQLGDNGPVKVTPVDVVALESGVTMLATGDGHTCALMIDRSVRCWGWNDTGQLGDGSTEDRLTPVDVAEIGSDVAAVSAGEGHTCALTTGGLVMCWGWNDVGQLGDGSTENRLTPVNASIGGVSAVSSGGGHTCALMHDGGIECWGMNNVGQLGDGTGEGSSTPVKVLELESDMAMVSAGWGFTCAVTSSGGARCWGWNSYGQLGDGSRQNRLAPVNVEGLQSEVVAIATGSSHACALMSDGGVNCWGSNSSGQLGNGGGEDSMIPVAVELGGEAVAIAAAGLRTCALMSYGGVKCWGSNYYGHIGDGSAKSRPKPVELTELGVDVAAIYTGYMHTCALMGDGRVKCWGSNVHGQLGVGGTVNLTSLPVDVEGL